MVRYLPRSPLKEVEWFNSVGLEPISFVSAYLGVSVCRTCNTLILASNCKYQRALIILFSRHENSASNTFVSKIGLSITSQIFLSYE